MACKVTATKSKSSENVKRINKLAMPNIHYVLSVLKEHTKSLDKNMRGRLEEIVDTIRKQRNIDFGNLEKAIAYCKELGAGDMTIKECEKKINRTRSPTKFKCRSRRDNNCKQDAVRHPLESYLPAKDVATINNISYSKDNMDAKMSIEAEIYDKKQISDLNNTKRISDGLLTQELKLLYCDPVNVGKNPQLNSVLQEVFSDKIKKESLASPNNTSSSEIDELEVIYNVSSSLDSRNTPDSINTLDYAVSSEELNKLKVANNKKLPKTLTGLIIKYYTILLGDMARNLNMYKLFSSQVLKPILEEELSCLMSAYDCWKEYLTYADAIVRLLQPYMMELVHLYPTNMQKELQHGIIGGQMPVVLVQALKNMKQWRAALEDTLLCVMGLTIKENRAVGGQDKCNIICAT